MPGTTCGSREGPRVGKIPSLTVPASGSWLRRAASRICSISATTRRARAATSRPAGVSITLRGARSTSATPSSSSSLRIWVDSVGWLTKHAAAARPKCRCSARATKYLRSRRFMGFLRFVLPVVVSGGFGLGLGRLRRAAGPDQVVERAERSLCAVAHRGDDLLVRRGGRVAGREHARQRRAAGVVDLDLAARRQLQRALEPFGVGPQADLHEHALQFDRSEEHTSELQSLMRTSYAVFCLKKKTTPHIHRRTRKPKLIEYSL